MPPSSTSLHICTGQEPRMDIDDEARGPGWMWGCEDDQPSASGNLNTRLSHSRPGTTWPQPIFLGSALTVLCILLVRPKCASSHTLYCPLLESSLLGSSSCHQKPLSRLKYCFLFSIPSTILSPSCLKKLFMYFNIYLFFILFGCTNSSILAWRIPWTEEPGRLWSIDAAKSQTQLSNFHFFFRSLLGHARSISLTRDWT